MQRVSMGEAAGSLWNVTWNLTKFLVQSALKHTTNTKVPFNTFSYLHTHTGF